jgi:hypothetical protein
MDSEHFNTIQPQFTPHPLPTTSQSGAAKKMSFPSIGIGTKTKVKILKYFCEAFLQKSLS